MIYITDAELLNVENSYELIGDFNFRNLQTFSIQGRISNFSNQDGVSGVWSGMSDRIYKDWNEINVMGVNLGSGKFLSISFPQGNDVRQKQYNLKFAVYNTGNLFNLTGADFTNLNINLNNFKYVQGLNEEFSFNRGEDGVYSYDRSLSFEILNTSGDTISEAKSIANTLFSGNSAVALLNASYPNFYNASGNKIYKESYDLAKNSYSFSENFRFVPNFDYIWTYTNSIQLGNGGIVNISEQGNIIGASKDRILDASGAFVSSISGGVYSRVSDIYTQYQNIISGFCNLYLQTKNVSFDNCVGAVNYEYQYTNDPTFTSSGYRWEYSTSIEKQDQYFIVAEAGSVNGIDSNKTLAWQNALNGWETEIKDGIKSRLESSYSNLLYIDPCSDGGILKKSKSSLDFSKYNASINYQNVYTTDEYTLEDDSNFSRVVVTSGDISPTHSISNYNIIGYKEIAQTNRTNNLGQFSWKVSIVGKTGLSIDSYLEKAFSSIYKPSLGEFPEDMFISDFSYELDPINNTFNLNLVYTYNKYRSLNDTLIW